METYVGARLFVTEPFKGYLLPERKLIVPFIFTGVGITTLNPSGQNGAGEYVLFRSLRPEGVDIPAVAAVVPVGVGGRFRLAPAVFLNLEVSLRILFSDYLDGVANPAVNTLNLTPEARQYIASIGPYQESLVGIMERADPNGGFIYKNGSPKYDDMYGILQMRVELYLRDLLSGKGRRVGRQGSSSCGFHHAHDRPAQSYQSS